MTIDLGKTRARAARMVTDQRSPTVGLTVQLSRETYNKFIMYAAKRGMSNSAALREIVERFVDEKDHAVRIETKSKNGRTLTPGPRRLADRRRSPNGTPPARARSFRRAR